MNCVFRPGRRPQFKPQKAPHQHGACHKRSIAERLGWPLFRRQPPCNRSAPKHPTERRVLSWRNKNSAWGVSPAPPEKRFGKVGRIVNLSMEPSGTEYHSVLPEDAEPRPIAKSMCVYRARQKFRRARREEGGERAPQATNNAAKRNLCPPHPISASNASQTLNPGFQSIGAKTFGNGSRRKAYRSRKLAIFYLVIFSYQIENDGLTAPDRCRTFFCQRRISCNEARGKREATALSGRPAIKKTCYFA
jgi:hypothetical protein